MRLAYKLSFLLACASAIPLFFSTAVTVRSSTEEVRTQLRQLYGDNARTLATDTGRSIQAAVEGLNAMVQTTGPVVNPTRLDPTERTLLKNFVLVGYMLNKDFDAVAVLNERAEVLEEFYLDANALRTGRGLGSLHDPLDAPTHQLFRGAIENTLTQLLDLEASGKPQSTGLSHPYVGPDEEGALVPRLVVLRRFQQGSVVWWVAAEVSLRHALTRARQHGLSPDVEVFILDPLGRTAVHTDPQKMAARADLSAHPALQGSTDWFGSVAMVQELGWKVVVAQPMTSAMAPVNRQVRTALFWLLVALTASGIIGTFGVRTVTKVVEKLRDAAAKIAAGQLETQVQVKGRDELGELGNAFNSMARGLRDRARLRESFSRYVSPEIAERILSETSDFELKGDVVRVTVLFIDARRFTETTEGQNPRDVVDMLNAYLEQIVDSIHRHNGVINKFIGDAVMAVFGVPRAVADGERRAVNAALDILERVEVLSARRRADHKPVMGFGIGVNTGQAIAGNIGSPDRLEYTVIGDAVNLAQRLQALANEGELIASSATLEGLAGAFRFEMRGAVRVKGKKLPIEVFRIVAPYAAASGS